MSLENHNFMPSPVYNLFISTFPWYLHIFPFTINRFHTLLVSYTIKKIFITSPDVRNIVICDITKRKTSIQHLTAGKTAGKVRDTGGMGTCNEGGAVFGKTLMSFTHIMHILVRS